MRQVRHLVELQPLDDAEAVPQGRGQQPGPGGGSHQGERGQVQLDGTRGGPLADHDIELVVLQGRVQDLFHKGAEAMDLVDEQHIPGLQVGHQGGDVARFLQHRARGGLEGHPHLVGDDAGQGGLAEARGAEDQGVVQRLAPAQGGLQENAHLLAHRPLAHVLCQGFGADGPVHGVFPRAGGGRGDKAVGFYHGAAQPLTMDFRARRISSSLLVTSSSLAAATALLASWGL